jgi:drug/metabolite transporter (DMT)-like permease
MLAGILLALLSALFFAASAALQASATRAIALKAPAPTGRITRLLPVLGLLPRMLVHRIWWAGLCCNVLGFVFHSSALHVGSISIVQALLCVQLMFALPFATARLRRPPLVRDWVGAAAACLGITTLVTARGSVPQTLDRSHLVPAVAITVVLTMGLLVAIAQVARATLRTALIGTAAGIGFSLTAVLIVVTADRLVHHGWWSLVTHWQVYAFLGSGLIAAVLAQDAFASGSFPAALTAMTVADPVAAWLWGAVLFDAVPPTTPVALASLAGSGILICIGVALLAGSPTMTRTHAPLLDAA